MKTFRITFTNQFANAWPILIYLTCFTLFPFYLSYRFGNSDLLYFIQSSLLLLSCFLLPQLWLHVNYLMINWKDVLIFSPIDDVFTYHHKGDTHIFKLGDIKALKQFKSFPLAENRLQWFPWDKYHFSIIKLNDDRQFVITSFLVPELETLVKREVLINKTFYPLPAK